MNFYWLRCFQNLYFFHLWVYQWLPLVIKTAKWSNLINSNYIVLKSKIDIQSFIVIRILQLKLRQSLKFLADLTSRTDPIRKTKQQSLSINKASESTFKMQSRDGVAIWKSKLVNQSFWIRVLVCLLWCYDFNAI